MNRHPVISFLLKTFSISFSPFSFFFFIGYFCVVCSRTSWGLRVNEMPAEREKEVQVPFTIRISRKKTKQNKNHLGRPPPPIGDAALPISLIGLLLRNNKNKPCFAFIGFINCCEQPPPSFEKKILFLFFDLFIYRSFFKNENSWLHLFLFFHRLEGIEAEA